MKTSVIIAAFASSLIFFSCTPKEIAPTVSVVPQPVSLRQFEGSSRVCGIKETIDTTLGPEEYILDTRGARTSITAGSAAGAFYAHITLDQLKQQGEDGNFARVLILDKPQFAYRGAHLDCCRQFWEVEKVKEFIDMMALHKLNTFHWHLTEDQGWRFESKKYPLLQEVAAYRKQTALDRKKTNKGYDGIRHGGYYTQEQMKEIVAYAAERFITVIPEIEMPGHATAALAAYPSLGCTGGPYEVECDWGVFPDIFCAGKEETFVFLQDILDEVCEIFPSEYIHIGGDEAPRTRWQKCPACQARIKAEGLKNEAELQSYLVRRIEKYLNDKGRKIIGWDEILEGGVTPTATIMSWRGAAGGKKAALQGNDVVMTPNKFYYFDYYQTKGRETNGEPYSIGGYVPLEKAYSFDPYEDLDDGAKAHIKGIQANMWCEFIREWDGVIFRELPRIAALAEVAWNADGRTQYQNFVQRVQTVLLPQYEARGWKYAPYSFNGIEEAESK